MVFDIILVVIGTGFLLVGLAGCILPVIPGPPLCYIALLFLQGTCFAHFSTIFLISTAVITVVVTLLDYLFPLWGTKKWGGSRMGAVGAIVGLGLGLFFPPVGIIVGPFFGAVAGELLGGSNSDKAVRAGFGSFMGFLMGTGIKLALCFALTFYFFKELFFS